MFVMAFKARDAGKNSLVGGEKNTIEATPISLAISQVLLNSLPRPGVDPHPL